MVTDKDTSHVPRSVALVWGERERPRASDTVHFLEDVRAFVCAGFCSDLKLTEGIDLLPRKVAERSIRKCPQGIAIHTTTVGIQLRGVDVDPPAPTIIAGALGFGKERLAVE